MITTDNFSRKFKQSGAWMSEYRAQSRNVEGGAAAGPQSVVPIVVNNNNFARGAEVRLA
jgi:peptidyl-dipeptidase Dcp